MIDRLFKAALLAVLLAFLYIAWMMKDNGRYVYHPETDKDLKCVIDSRTGTVFFLAVNQGIIEVHPQTGKQLPHQKN